MIYYIIDFKKRSKSLKLLLQNLAHYVLPTLCNLIFDLFCSYYYLSSSCCWLVKHLLLLSQKGLWYVQ
jgi:hypothetical protein